MRDYEELVDRLRAGTYTVEELSIILPRAADAIEELICDVADEHNRRLDAEEAQEWISVEERLPEKNMNYLTYGVFLPLNVKAIDLCRFDERRFLTDPNVKITHWMPMPEPPKEDDNG